MDLISNPHYHQTTGTIDHPRSGPAVPTYNDPMTFTFTAGQFVGRTLCVELVELQKAEIGSTYDRVDRRPLDPPPVVLLRLFEAGDLENGRDDYERELLYKDVLNIGLICTIDLFPVPETFNQPGSPASQSSTEPSYQPSHDHDYPPTYYLPHPYDSTGASSSIQAIPPPVPNPSLMLSPLHPSEIPADAVHQIRNHIITESSKLTSALVGEKFAEASFVSYQGKKALVFVFGDLAVRREGVFLLRYRVFDIFSSVPGNPHAPVLAGLYGSPFKVFSTGEFPGLKPSTDLTKDLVRFGVRLNVREAEQRWRKRTKDSE